MEKLSNVRSSLTQDYVCDFCIMAIKTSFTKSMSFGDIIDKFAEAKCRKTPIVKHIICRSLFSVALS